MTAPGTAGPLPGDLQHTIVFARADKMIKRAKKPLGLT